jgi:hypothetical protein
VGEISNERSTRPFVLEEALGAIGTLVFEVVL